ncbi:MAG: adenylate/guanylate cyclase domain-containing protein [Candidatus Eremiobacteraeota bacterium]|nr:adenylate/guanylate cyclase domain-containing protein [Candidatus Eremiobacteraeota bacterium]
MTALLLLALLAVVAVSLYASSVFRRYLHERDEHGRVRALFSRYVPPQVVDDLLERKDPRLFEGQQYYATIMCCRIRNFALFVENLSPQQTLQYLNEFYTIAGKSIEKHRGMIESLRGDTITAVFGVLIDDPFQEERALRAALDITRLVNGMSARWQAQGRKPFIVGIGINSGEIVAGDTGFQRRREFALVGNEVHVAAALQELTEETNASIIASDATYAAVEELFVGIAIKAVPLRGLKKLQKAYIIRGLSKRAEELPLTLPPERSIPKTNVRSDIPSERAAPIAMPVIRETTHHFSSIDDDAPAMPDPPMLEGTYEDDLGPPFRLR